MQRNASFDELVKKVARQRLAALQAGQTNKPRELSRDWSALRFLEFADLVSGERLSPAQRVFCGIAFEGREPREFEGEEWEIAQRLLKPPGQSEPVESIPRNARAVVTLVKGARIGGTYMSALYAAHRALKADLSTLAPGELGRVIFGASKIDFAQQALSYVAGAYESQADLANMVRHSSSTRLVIQRPNDGREVEFVTRSADRGGASFRSRTLICACLTEVAFFLGADHVANDEDCFRAVTPRILPGGLTILESTPYAEAGLLHAEFERNWGRPTTSVAFHAPTMFMLPTERNRVAYENMLATDPENAEREFGAAFIPFGSAVFFPRDLLRRCAVKGKGSRGAPGPGEVAGIGGDFGLSSDGAGFVAVHRRAAPMQPKPDGTKDERRDPRADIYRVEECVERRPARGVPLRLKDLVPLACDTAGRHGQKSVLVDGWSVQAARENLGDEATGTKGYSLDVEQQAEEAELFESALELMKSGLVEIPEEHEALLRQLPLVMSKPMPGGRKKIILPKKFGSHCDLVPAFVRALWRAKRTPVGSTVDQPKGGRRRAMAGGY